MHEAKQIVANTDNSMIKTAAIPGIQSDDEHNCLYLQQTVAIEARLKQVTSRKKNTDHSVNEKSYKHKQTPGYNYSTVQKNKQ